MLNNGLKNTQFCMYLLELNTSNQPLERKQDGVLLADFFFCSIVDKCVLYRKLNKGLSEETHLRYKFSQ